MRLPAVDPNQSEASVLNDRDDRNPTGRPTDYDRQAREDFAIWELLEKAGLLPPLNVLPTRRLIKEAQRRLGLEPARPATRHRGKRRRS